MTLNKEMLALETEKTSEVFYYLTWLLVQLEVTLSTLFLKFPYYHCLL